MDEDTCTNFEEQIRGPKQSCQEKICLPASCQDGVKMNTNLATGILFFLNSFQDYLTCWRQTYLYIVCGWGKNMSTLGETTRYIHKLNFN